MSYLGKNYIVGKPIILQNYARPDLHFRDILKFGVVAVGSVFYLYN